MQPVVGRILGRHESLASLRWILSMAWIWIRPVSMEIWSQFPIFCNILRAAAMGLRCPFVAPWWLPLLSAPQLLSNRPIAKDRKGPKDPVVGGWKT